MNAFLSKVLDERFAKSSSQSNGAPGQKKVRKRAVIDLALESYRSQLDGPSRKDAGIDEEFKQAAMVQIRAFILAGQ